MTHVIWDWMALCGLDGGTAITTASRQTCPRRDLSSNGRRLWYILVAARMTSGKEAKQDIEVYRAQSAQRRYQQRGERARKLRKFLEQNHSKSRPYRVAHFPVFLGIIIADLFVDLSQSMIVEITVNLFWFGLAITDLVTGLQDEDVDLNGLLEWKFGQVMPMLLLFVFGFSAIEAHKSLLSS